MHNFETEIDAQACNVSQVMVFLKLLETKLKPKKLEIGILQKSLTFTEIINKKRFKERKFYLILDNKMYTEGTVFALVDINVFFCPNVAFYCLREVLVINILSGVRGLDIEV